MLSCEVWDTLRTPILKNICKRLLLGVLYKKAVLKKLFNIHSTKVARYKVFCEKDILGG